MKTLTSTLDFIPEIDIKSICSPEEMLFFDIETTGLKKETTQVYLIGCAFLENEDWKIRQWLSERISDEEYLLDDFLDFAGNFKMLVHFNGDGFDIPYINYKADYYMFENSLRGFETFDIYKKSKICRQLLGMTSMSQKSIESFLGIRRDDTMDGGSLIPVYYNYEKTGLDTYEKLLLLHNYDDIQGMLKILPVLRFADIMEGNFAYKEHAISDDIFISRYILEKSIPVSFENAISIKGGDQYRISAADDILEINSRIYESDARLYMENISDYYYLPDEDRIIHKDLAAFIEKKGRIKATKKNCFVRKHGRFIPYFNSWDGKIYFSDDDPKKKLIDIDDIQSSDSMHIYSSMAKDILESISSC